MKKLLTAGMLALLGTGQVAWSANEKVTLCHNGNSITVAQPAVSAHMAHGDTEGACADGEGGPSNTLAVVMLRCEAQIDNGVVVVSASTSEDIGIDDGNDMILNAGDDCAKAVAELAQMGFGLKSITSGSAGGSDDLHLYTDYLLFGRIKNN